MWSKTELIDKKARFWVLMAKGSTLQGACDAVGVNRRTGRHWRQGTGGQIPRKRPEPSGRYLSVDERLQIADLCLVGAGVRTIATQIARSPSTASRELRRNGPQPGLRKRGTYAPYAAQKRAELRGRRPKASKFDNPELASWVQAKLCVKWSPEQISDHLAAVLGDRQEMQVSPETIYQALYVQGRGHLRADLHQHLREALRMVFACREGVVVSRTKAINELKSLIVVAPEQLRAELRGRTLQVQVTRIEQLPTPTTAPVEHRLSVLTLQSIAARIRFLSAQLAELDPQLLELITQHPAGPALLAQAGVGPVVAAQLLISWSHPGRVRSEAAFASLAGVAPLEVSSGQRSRHRLNRGGDRALNRALHTVAITRMRCHPETRAYETRRNAEGKTHRDVRRSVKRALARRLYRTIETATRLHELPNAP